jgi:hypothetical protein
MTTKAKNYKCRRIAGKVLNDTPQGKRADFLTTIYR